MGGKEGLTVMGWPIGWTDCKGGWRALWVALGKPRLMLRQYALVDEIPGQRISERGDHFAGGDLSVFDRLLDRAHRKTLVVSLAVVVEQITHAVFHVSQNDILHRYTSTVTRPKKTKLL